MRLDTRLVGALIIVAFLLNVGLAASGQSLVSLPMGVAFDSRYIPPTPLDVLNDTWNSIVDDSWYGVLQNVSFADKANLMTSKVDARSWMIQDVFFQSNRGDPEMVQIRATSGIKFNGIGAENTPRKLVEYLWSFHQGEMKAQGYADYAALEKAVFGNTDTAKLLSQKYGFGYRESCSAAGNIACNGADPGTVVSIEPAAKYWTPEYMATLAQTYSDSGYSQTEIFNAILNQGFDIGFAFNTIAELNSRSGTSYFSVQKGDVDPTIYGSDPFVVKYTVPTYAFTATCADPNCKEVTGGAVMYPGLDPNFNIKTANCGGQSCYRGGGDSYFIVPTEVANTVGVNKLKQINSILTAMAIDMPVVADISNAACRSGCLTVNDVKMFVANLNDLSAAINAWEKKTGHTINFSGIPLEAGLPSYLQHAQIPSQLDYALSTIFHDPAIGQALIDYVTKGTANGGLARIPITGTDANAFNKAYAKALLDSLKLYGWTQIGLNHDGSVNMYTWLRLQGVMLSGGISKAEIDAALAKSIDIRKKLEANKSDPKYIGMIAAWRLGYLASGCLGNCPNADWMTTDPKTGKSVAKSDFQKLATMSPAEFLRLFNNIRTGVPGAGIDASLRKVVMDLAKKLVVGYGYCSSCTLNTETFNAFQTSLKNCLKSCTWNINPTTGEVTLTQIIPVVTTEPIVKTEPTGGTDEVIMISRPTGTPIYAATSGNVGDCPVKGTCVLSFLSNPASTYPQLALANAPVQSDPRDLLSLLPPVDFGWLGVPLIVSAYWLLALAGAVVLIYMKRKLV